MNTQVDTLVHLIKRSVKKFPHAPVILAPNSPPLSYQQLLALIEQNHHYLNTCGLGKNSRIASVLPNMPAAASVFLAISSSCTFAPLNPNYTQDEFEFYLSSLKPSALIILRGFESPARQVAQKLDIPVLELIPDDKKGASYFSLMGKTGLLSSHCDYVGATDIALLLHTSGSTSEPKIVPFQHKALCKAFASSGHSRKFSTQDRVLNSLPLFHLQGLSSIINVLLVGGSCVYAYPFEPERFIAWLDEFDPTCFSASPTMHQAILEQAQRTEHFYKNPSLRFISSSSAALPLAQINSLESLFRVPLIELYGMTETLHISGNPLPPKVRKPGSVGIATNTKISIVDNTLQSLPVNVVGEIVVQSSWLMMGYINNQHANDQVFSAKGFRTGDIGYLDEDGYLFITGRVKEIINRGGEKISPFEVEQVLLANSSVEEVTVFPVPHPTLGENVAAALVLKENQQISPAALQVFIQGKLANFKIPYRILICNHIPKSAIGKVQRHKLADYFAAQLSAQDIKPNQVNAADNSPPTPLQTYLLTNWQDLLKIKSIGIHDNLLALGGNSLLATQLMVRISNQFNIDVPLRIFFESSTISELSSKLEPIISNKNLNTSHSIKALARENYRIK